jgi:hypothetical protein
MVQFYEFLSTKYAATTAGSLFATACAMREAGVEPGSFFLLDQYLARLKPSSRRQYIYAWRIFSAWKGVPLPKSMEFQPPPETTLLMLRRSRVAANVLVTLEWGGMGQPVPGGVVEFRSPTSGATIFRLSPDDAKTLINWWQGPMKRMPKKKDRIFLCPAAQLQQWLISPRPAAPAADADEPIALPTSFDVGGDSPPPPPLPPMPEEDEGYESVIEDAEEVGEG